jgi:AsmA protein
MAAGAPTPQPIRIDYVATYRLDNGRGRIDDSSLRFGATRVAVNGSFDNRPKVLQLDMHINGRQLPVDDVQPLLPVFGVVLPKNSRLSGGSLGLDLHAQGPLDALVITGPVTLDNSRLAGFSLGSQLGSALTLAGIKAPKDTVIRHAEAALTIAPSGIRANPARADIVDLGNLTGQGGMAADGRLDFRMLVKLDKAIAGSAQGGQGLSGLLGNSGAGRMLGGVLGNTAEQGIGVHVTGTASAPSFKIDPTAVTGLIKAGLAGSRGTAARTPASDKPTRKKDVLDSLLKDALRSKSGH